jgi:hypothetical protein
MKRIAAFLLLAGCASMDGAGLVPGQSTAADVEATMGRAADKRPGAGGETVYYYPRLPWGYATYAARIAPDGKLVALEQRLTPENAAKLHQMRTHEVRDLLGPPFEPMKDLGGREIWTYPMRVPGDPTPKWLLVHFTTEGAVRETQIIDDPHWNQPDSVRRLR